MSLSESGEQLDLRVPSEYVQIETVVDATESFLSTRIDDDEYVYRIVLSTSEAVTNAIRHGNQLDPTKHVDVVMSVVGDGVHVTVSDEGGGFDRQELRDPLAEDNLLSEGGRGIFLIESMADEVAYEDGGRCLRMVFRPVGGSSA